MNVKGENVTFRFAAEKDCSLILSFIHQLAAYEKMSDQVVATKELLREWIFAKQKAEVLFICDGEREVGFALFFHNFSTFLGRAGIYLEDLFVLPAYRNKGYGKALLKKLARITVERGCGRLHRFLYVTGCCSYGRLDNLSPDRGNTGEDGKMRDV